MHVDLVIPAYDEEGNLERTVSRTVSTLRERADDWTFGVLLTVGDGSSDRTPQIADRLESAFPEVDVLHRSSDPGFGNAIKDGLAHADGDVLVPFMADLSDDPADVPKLVERIREGHDVVYGSRFVDGGSVDGYPPVKLFYNRAFNNLVRILFGIRARDVTNAFTAYRREVIEEIGVENLRSESFDVTAELPLHAHVRGFKSAEVPVSWRGRQAGVSKLDATQKGPLYVRRLLEMFVVGNALGLRDLFDSFTGQRRTRAVAAALLGIAVLVGLFSMTGFEEVFALVADASPAWVGLAIGSYATSFLFRTWRWRVLLRTAGHLADRGGTFRCIMFGWLLNLLLPARMGDVARSMALKTTEEVPFSVGSGTVVIERALDMLVLGGTMLLVGSLFLRGERAVILSLGAIGIAAVLIAALAAAYFFPDRAVARIGELTPRIESGLDALSDALERTARNPQAIALATLLSLPVWLFEIGTIFLSARAVGVEIDAVPAVVTAVAAFVAQSLPLSPGGIGTYEATIVATLSLFDVPTGPATALGVVDHFGRIALVAVVGLVSAVHLGFRSRTYFREGTGDVADTSNALDDDAHARVDSKTSG